MHIESLESRLQGLDSRVSRAFDDQPIPTEIVTHACEKCELLDADLRSVPWRDVSDVLIEKHFSQLPLLSPAAFAYYIPAYVRFALRNFDRHSKVLEFLVYSIAPSNDENPEWKRERVRLFTRAQFEILQEFLQLVVEQDEMRLYFGTLAAERTLLEVHWNERWKG